MSDAIQLAEYLGSKYTLSGDDVMISCPRASVSSEHGFGKDRHPSFGILTSDNMEQSMCNCFACGIKGRVSNVFNRLYRQGVVSYDTFKFVSERDAVTVQTMLNRLNNQGKTSAIGYKQTVSLDTERYALNRGCDSYFYQRGITQKEVAKFRLGYNLGECRATFPIYSLQGEYCGYVGRTLIGDSAKYKKHYVQGHEHVLFGEQLLDPSLREVILVEGPVDAIYMLRIFKNTLAINGSSLTASQVDHLLYYTRSITIMLDGDAAGRAAAFRLYEDLHTRIYTSVCLLPEGKDPDQLTPEALISCYRKKFNFLINFS